MEPAAMAQGELMDKRAVPLGHSHKAHPGSSDLAYVNDGCSLRDTRGLFPRYPHFVEAFPSGRKLELWMWR